mmetsp:Transcript_16723/g.16158  ORF Transcript_16723/g.16158 Transcript_16723/m.16158 type:complete len:438 (-) Transcript_16723:169-1482(-)
MKVQCFLSLLGGLLVLASSFQLHRPVLTGTLCGAPLNMVGIEVDIGESTPRDIATMDEWATACNVERAEGFQFTSSDGLDIEVMAGQDIERGNPVLYVPGDMILSSIRSQQEFGQVKAAEELLKNLDYAADVPQFYLFLKILVEYEKGDESPWFPWLNSLPRMFTNGASMTPFCYECLPPLAAAFAMDGKFKVINFRAALKKVEFISDRIKDDKDVAKWAFQVVSTRGVHYDGDVRLAPLADMFNHGTETNVDVTYDEEGNCYAHATIDVSGGSLLRMSYGDPTNPSQLFARYGFLDETCPASFCKIMIGKPSTQLKDMGYDYSRMLFYKDTGEVSEEVWDVLLYQNLGESNRQAQNDLYQAHITGDYATKQSIHQQHYPETLASLQRHLDTFLNQLDELSSKGVGMDYNTHPRLPLILRHNEFVKETFMTVKSQLG